MSSTELVALVCCDLGGIVRGRSLMVAELGETLRAGVGWVPANHSLTPHGPLAARTPFDSTGDLRLLPDPGTHVRVEAESSEAGTPAPAGIPVSTEAETLPSARIPLSASSGRAGGPPDTGANALELVLCDIVETDGTPWECCPRRFLRDALAELERELGARVVASFEHEFQLLGAEGATGAFSLEPPAAPFSLEAQRRAEPFAAEAIGALVEAGVQPERIFAEFAPHQFEIPVEAAEGVAAADRSVVLKEVVREVARRRGLRATFTPLLHPDGAGQRRAHPSQSDRRRRRPTALRRGAPGLPERAGGSLCGGDPSPRAGAQRTVRPQPGVRRAPHPPPLERGRGVRGRAQP